MQREFGRYRLIRHLATGGMGEVYLAEAMGAAGFAKRVVIKTLRADLAADAELVRQFVAEGQLLEALDHPNIAQILDLGLVSDTYFLAMEMVEGFDLRALQRALPTPAGQPARLREGAIAFLIASVARALDHAATRRGPDGRPLAIVHHDVTPSNIMVRRDGHVKLVDFGVARSALVSRLSAGALRGKLPYLSPEHARHQRVDGRADLFSLGLVAFELATGQRALEVGEPESLENAYAHLPGKLEALSATGLIGTATLELLVAMTRIDLERRCRDAGEVADRADQLLIALCEASPARSLAAELEPAFAVLEARASSFDQMLAQTLGLESPDSQGSAHDGTVSLPGLEVVGIAASSARDELLATPGRPNRRGRKRLATAALAALLAAGSLGWWFGARRDEARAATEVASPGQVARVGPRALRPEGSAGPARSAPAMAGIAAGDPAGTHAKPHPEPARAGRPGSLGRPEPAVAGPGAPTATAEADPDRGSTRKGTERQGQDATVKFLVLPADCIVTVDGERHRPVRDNRYEIAVKPGVAHRIQVTDPSSRESRVVEVQGLERGIARSLPNFIFGSEFE